MLNIFSSCTHLNLVVSENPVPPTVGEHTFFNISSVAKLQVPDESTEAYKSATGWATFFDSEQLPHVKSIVQDYIRYELTLETLTAEVVKEEREIAIGVPTSYDLIIPSTITDGTDVYTVTSIRKGAFHECMGIQSATLPEGITTIGEMAFSNCRYMTSINIPESVTSIGEKAFDGCQSLSVVTFGEGLKSLGKGAFSQTGISSLVLPNSLSSIPARAFEKCSSLQKLQMGTGVITIGDRAFADCSRLSVDLSDTDIDFAESAFVGWYRRK